jgi:hypothetical protein
MFNKIIFLMVTIALLSYSRESYTANPAFPLFGSLNVYANDTLLQYQKRATQILAYLILNGGGPIFGNGNEKNGILLSVAAGEYYDAIGNLKVIEVLFLADQAKVKNNPDTIIAKVCQTNADTTPGTVLGSGTISVKDIVTGSSIYNSVKIQNGQSTGNKPFLVILEWGTAIDDSIGILSSCAETKDGKNENRARLSVNPIFTNGGWKAAQKQIGSGFDVDVMIIPVVEKNTGISNAPLAGELVTFNGYISKTGKTVTISYSLHTSQTVSVKIFDLCGKTILMTDARKMNAGDHSITVDLKNRAAGNYYYTITAGSFSLTGKIVAIR